MKIKVAALFIVLQEFPILVPSIQALKPKQAYWPVLTNSPTIQVFCHCQTPVLINYANVLPLPPWCKTTCELGYRPSCLKYFYTRIVVRVISEHKYKFSAQAVCPGVDAFVLVCVNTKRF